MLGNEFVDNKIHRAKFRDPATPKVITERLNELEISRFRLVDTKTSVTLKRKHRSISSVAIATGEVLTIPMHEQVR
jgi:hypothetical protein